MTVGTLVLGVLQIDAACPPDERTGRLGHHLSGFGTGLDLVVCPELFVPGYGIEAAALRALAQPLDGRYVAELGALARTHGCTIHTGFAEREGETFYNTSVTIGSDGGIVARYRKRILPPGIEADVFSPGDGGPGFAVRGVPVQPLICYEVEFPECVRAAAKAGAALIAAPTALKSKWGVVADSLIATRAFENGIYVAYANYTGADALLDYYGGSCIVAPDGQLLAQAGRDEALITAEVDVHRATEARATLPYLEDLEKLGF